MSEDWQNACDSVVSRMAYLYDSKILSDCSFKANNSDGVTVRLQAHRLILASGSPVFFAMVFGEMKSADDVIIEDVSAVVLNEMFRYIYTNEFSADITYLDVCALYYAADKYIMDHLKKKCIMYLKTQLTTNNCCYAFELAQVHDETKLMNLCLKMFSNHTSNVLLGDSFLGARLGTIKTIYSFDVLSIQSELELFMALERYVEANTIETKINTSDENNILGGVNSESRQEVTSDADTPDTKSAFEDTKKDPICIDEILHLIHFLSMTPAEFAAGPAHSSLLSQSVAFALLVKICNSEDNSPMPEGFSTQRQKRNEPYRRSYYR